MIGVLLVAPSTNLDWQAAEVEALINLTGLRVRLVRSPATHRSVMDMIDNVRMVDILWFCGHGTAAGVILDDGLFDLASLTIAVEQSRCNLVVLNTCSSIALAGQIAKHGTDAMATITDQDDRRAWMVATSFARDLVRGGLPSSVFLRTAAHDPNTQYIKALP
jgi:hypothetical protein